MSAARPTALVADDEPLLREALVRQLAQAWPELEVVAEARNGREALTMFEAHQPDICFLDVQMPGINGVEAAREIGRRAHLVFVTAFDHYAVQAFAQGVLDYLVKPVELARLSETVARLQERLRADQPATHSESLLQQLTQQLARLQTSSGTEPLRWIRAQVGQTLRLIATDDIVFLRADSKYTLVAWRGDDGRAAEALVRTPLRELAARLDPAQFVQVHRSAIVNLRAVDHVRRGDNETADIHLKGRPEILPVSRNFLHLFKQM
jgi:DNA-binding LytR/AlgR family response regulator